MEVIDDVLLHILESCDGLIEPMRNEETNKQTNKPSTQQQRNNHTTITQ
jgi:hypothetical protein